MEIGEIYIVKEQYTVSIGCNILQSKRAIEITNSNKEVLENQQWKLEKQVSNLENKMMKRPVGKLSNKIEK